MVDTVNNRTLQYASRTLPSKKKPYKRTNEDAFITETFADDHIFVTADGNDLGHLYSTTLSSTNISSMACQCFIECYKQSAQQTPNLKDRMVVTLMKTIEWVCSIIEEDPSLQYQATTLTSIILSGDQYLAAHVGDSALTHYSKDSGKVDYVTKSSQDGGTALFIQPSSKSLLLERVSPNSRHLERHIYQGAALGGDLFLLTTDGLLHLWNRSSNEQNINSVVKVLAEQEKEPAEIMDYLFEVTDSVKTHDDLTCFIIKIK